MKIVSNDLRLLNQTIDPHMNIQTGYQMTRKGKNFFDLGKNDFGIFCGTTEKGKFVIGIKNFPNWDIKFLELFDSYEELTQQWVVD